MELLDSALLADVGGATPWHRIRDRTPCALACATDELLQLDVEHLDLANR